MLSRLTRSTGITLSFFLITGAFSQTSSVPYADNDGPTFASQQTVSSYPGNYQSIRKVNFRTLKDVGRGSQDPDDHYAEQLDDVYYLTGPASTGNVALVIYSWIDGFGSSTQGNYATVFAVKNQHLQSIQQISWDTHFVAGQPTESFDPRTNTLTISSAHYLPGDAHCCISAIDVITFRWDGTKFAQTGLRTELSEYGKHEGKTLPH